MLPGSMPWQCDVSIQCELLQAPPAVEPYETTGDVLNTIVRPFRGPPLNNYTATSFESNHHNHHHGHGHAHGHLSATLKRGLSAISQHHLSPVGAVSNCSAAGSMAINVVGNLRKSISNTFDAGKSLQGRPAAGAATASSSAALANSGGNKQGAPNNVHSPHHMFGLRSQDSLPAYSSLQNEPDDDSSLRSLDTLASCSSTGQSPRKLQLQLQQQHGGHIQASGSQSAGCEQQQQQAGLIGQLASKLTRQSSKKFTASKKGLQRALSFDYRGYKRLDGSQTGAGSAAASRAHHGHGTLVNSATLQASADSTASSTGSACSNNNNSLLAARHKPHNKSTLALQSPRPYLPQSASQVDFQVPLLPYERMQEAIVSQRLLEPPSVASASATGGGGGGQSNSAPPGSPCAPDSERKHHVTPVKQPDVDELICGGGPTVMQVETIKTTATTTSESGDNSYQSPGISSTQQQAGEQQERQRAGNHRRRTPPHEPPKLVLNIPAKSGRRLRYDPQLVGDANRDDDYDDDDDQEDGNANAGTGASSAVITCLPSPNVIIEPIFSETSLESSGEADDKSQQQQQQLLLLGNSRPGQMSQSPSFCIHPDGKTASFKHLGGGHNHNHDDNDDDNDDDNSACGNGSSSCQLGGANGLQSNLLTASDVFNNSKNFIKRPSTMMADVDGVEAMNQVVQALESKAASSRQQLTHSASVRSHNRRQAIVPPKLATDACMSPESETRDQPQVGKLVELADDDDGDGNNYDNEKRRVDKAVGGRSSRSAGRGVRSTRQTGGAGQLADEFGAEEEAEMSTLRRKRSGGGIEKAAPAVAPDKSHRRRQQNAANNGNADDGGLPTFSIEPDRDGNDIQSAGGQQQPIKGHECEPGGGGGDQQRARPDSQATNAESIVSSSSSTNLSAIGAGRFSANSATSGGLSVPFASGGSGSNQRRRSSIAVIPQMQICPGDLLVYSKQLIERMNQSDENEPPPFLKIDDKKGKNIWSSFKLCAQFDNRYMRARNELLCSLEDVLASLQPSTFVDEQLSHYKGMLWNEFLYETESRRSASSEIMNPDGDLNNNGNNEAGQDEAAGQDGWRVGARKKKSYRDDLVDVRISSPSPVSTSPSKVDGQQQQQQQHKRSGSMRANETRATGAPSATAAQAGHEAVKATMSSGNHASPGKPLPVSISSTGGGQQRALSSRFREKPKLKRGQTVDSVFRIPLIPSSPLKHAQQHQQTPTAHLEDLNTIEDDERSSVYSATSSTGAGTVAPSTSPRHSDARKRSSSTRSRSGSRPRQLATTCESPTSGAGGGESSKDVASPARAGKQLTSGTGSSNEKSQESSFDADDTNDLMYGGTGTGSGGAGKRGAGQMVRQTSLSTLSSTITRTEQKRQRALWDLFQSECTFFFDHLMTLKNVYMEPLKKIQVEGFAMFADPDVLFGNLDELCCGVYDFCKEFLYIIMRTLKTRPEELNATDVLIKLYKKNPKIDHLRAVYHRYTLNYINALTYLESLRRQVEFVEFEKWSSRDVRCKKLQLTDLLVAPVQHIMRVPIILKDIEAHTENLKDRDEIRAILAVEEASLRELDDKMRWLKNFERLLEIQKNISWPSVLDMDPKLYVPEFLKEVLSKQPCEKLIVSPRRQIVHEGTLSNFDLSGKASDMHVILFDDMLLMTRRKKCLTKKSSTVCKTNSAGHHGGVGCGGGSGSGGGAGGGGGGSGGTGSHSSSSMMRDDGSYRYIVYKQPLSLDRFYVHDVQQVDSQSVGIKHLFLLIVMNRFQQIIGVHSFGAPNDDLKQTWLFKIKKTAERWKRNYSNSSTSNEQQQQQQICTSKSMPMDALNGTTTCRRPHASSSKPTTRQPSSASGRFTGSKEATKLANTTRSMSDADEPSATVKYQSRQQHYESILSVTSDSGDTDRQSPAAGGLSRTSTPQQAQQQQQAIEFVITSASDSPAHNSSATPTIIAPGQTGQPSR